MGGLFGGNSDGPCLRCTEEKAWLRERVAQLEQMLLTARVPELASRSYRPEIGPKGEIVERDLPEGFQTDSPHESHNPMEEPGWGTARDNYMTKKRSIQNHEPEGLAAVRAAMERK